MLYYSKFLWFHTSLTVTSAWTEAVAQIFSWMKGCISAWLIGSLLDASNISMRSNRSFNWFTFRAWSSGRFWLPTSSACRSRIAFIVDMTTTFSWEITNNSRINMDSRVIFLLHLECVWKSWLIRMCHNIFYYDNYMFENIDIAMSCYYWLLLVIIKQWLRHA